MLMALLGQARHTRLEPVPLMKVVFAPQLQVRASEPETPPAGQVRHGLPLVRL